MRSLPAFFVLTSFLLLRVAAARFQFIKTLALRKEELSDVKLEQLPLSPAANILVPAKAVGDFRKFDAIDNKETKIGQIVCKDTIEPNCTPVVDIVYVLDGSGSIGPSAFAVAKNFLVSLTQSLVIGTGNQESRVGMVRFNHLATTRFGLDAHTTNAAAQAAITAVPYPGGGTCIACGMMEAINNVFVTPGDRDSVPNVMVVLTDGQDASSLISAQQAAAAKGIHVYAIGIGSGIDVNQLKETTGDENHVFTVANFNGLDCVLKPLIDEICNDTKDTTDPCEPAPLDCTGVAYGDPHYTSYHGNHFDWQGTCRVVVSEVCDEFVGQVPYFQISHTGRMVGTGSVAVLETVFIVMYGNMLEIGSASGVKLNGVVQNIAVGGTLDIAPAHVPNGPTVITVERQSTNGYLVETEIGIRISIIGSHLKVTNIPGKYHGKLCGLFGDCNEDGTKEMRKKDGTIATTASQFGNSWVIDDFCSDCVLDDGPTKSVECSGAEKELAAGKCKIILDPEGPFAACQASMAINIKVLYENCVLDYCATKNFCLAIEAAVVECKGSEPAVGWSDSFGKGFGCKDGKIGKAVVSLPGGNYIGYDVPTSNKLSSAKKVCFRGERNCGGLCGPSNLMCCGGNGGQCPREDQKCCTIDGSSLCVPETHKCCGKHFCDPGYKCCGDQCIHGSISCCSEVPCPTPEYYCEGGVYGKCALPRLVNTMEATVFRGKIANAMEASP